jgi:hypothetical protein
MQGELRSLTTVEGDLIDDLVFVEGEDFEIGLLAEIGPKGEEGAELFYLTALSPSIVGNLAKDGPRFLRHFLVMKSFDESTAKDAVERLCRRTNGPDWKSVAEKLARYMAWEFEDYQELEPSNE